MQVTIIATPALQVYTLVGAVAQLLSDNISASRPMLSHHQRTYDLCLLRWILVRLKSAIRPHNLPYARPALRARITKHTTHARCLSLSNYRHIASHKGIGPLSTSDVLCNLNHMMKLRTEMTLLFILFKTSESQVLATLPFSVRTCVLITLLSVFYTHYGWSDARLPA
ncbi:hypothetical protein IWW34DRAFT_339917 [Fusarium oxysporum f. sp. albedinis]|nr:hypothetical protein IWW34DRAFT_339917 [Fusarium oxysporum f. sp. albedinis]